MTFLKQKLRTLWKYDRKMKLVLFLQNSLLEATGLCKYV